jgi:DNA-binding LacI/PurR family transcriptional regulator
MGKKYVSLKDLADELNVSVSTVSRALKDHPDISLEMRRKVRQLAELKQYSPNPLAMGLLKQETRIIGVVIPDIVTHFYSSIIAGIESVARENGYFVLISSSNESLQKEIESINNLLKARVEGFIVCLSKQTKSYEHFENLLKRNIPLVFFDRTCMENDVSCVTVDNRDASRKVVHHFYQQGYRRIAFISGPEYLNISTERVAGYFDGLNECNLPIDPDLLVMSDLGNQSTREEMNRLLNLQEKPDALFGVNDFVVFAAMKEIRSFGLKFPDDIGLVGFTDDFHATVVTPELTSIIHPTFQIGESAARLFIDQTQGRCFPQKIVLQTELKVRDSSVLNR